MWMNPLVERWMAAGPVVLPLLLDSAFKGALILALTAMVTLAMRRASAAARHLAWFLGTAGLLTMPILSAVVPRWNIMPSWATSGPRDEVQAAKASAISAASTLRAASTPPAFPAMREGANDLPGASNATAAGPATTPWPSSPAMPPRAPVPWQAWILTAWLGVSFALLGYLAAGFLSLWRLRRHASRVTDGAIPVLLRELSAGLGIDGRVELLASSRRAMPMTWGLWRTCLLLPEEATAWDAAVLRAVLLHELAHAKRRDCLTQLAAQTACALYWFNPLVWLAWRRMQMERERACDDLVLRTGTKASAYAEHLLRFAAELRVVRYSGAAIAMARPCTLERRLLAILDATRNRRAITRRGLCLALLLLAAAAVPVAMLRAGEKKAKEGDPLPPPAAPTAADSLSTAAAPPDGFGRVVDVAGRPVAHAKLHSKQSNWKAESGPEGLFPLPELRPANQYVDVAYIDIAARGFAGRKDVGLSRNGYGEILPNKGVLELHRIGRLQGRVLGPDGKPLAGAPLSIDLCEKYPDLSATIGNARQAKSDRDGRFTIENLPPGDILLYYPGEPRAKLPVVTIGAALPIKLADGQRLTDVVLDLSKSVAAAEGRVVDSEHKPLPNADVSLCWKHDSGWNGLGEIASVKSDARGHYRIEKLPIGSWGLWAWHGDMHSEPAPVELSARPATVPDLVISVIQAANGRIRRAQPLRADQTAREWIDAMLAKDADGAAAVVAPGSPLARNGERIRALLAKIGRFTTWSESDATGNATTNELDLGNGRRGSLKFLLRKEGGQWRVYDVLDDRGRSLMEDSDGGSDAQAAADKFSTATAPPDGFGRVVDVEEEKVTATRGRKGDSHQIQVEWET